MVAEIADLPKLDAHAFFAETHITEGMGVLCGKYSNG
jgi:predicted AAA+ superfamily ATPase